MLTYRSLGALIEDEFLWKMFVFALAGCRGVYQNRAGVTLANFEDSSLLQGFEFRSWLLTKTLSCITYKHGHAHSGLSHLCCMLRLPLFYFRSRGPLEISLKPLQDRSDGGNKTCQGIRPATVRRESPTNYLPWKYSEKKKNKINKENSAKLPKEFDIKKCITCLYSSNNQLESKTEKTSFTIAINFKALRNKSNKRYVRPLWRKITKYY